jgi:hypothetical protein
VIWLTSLNIKNIIATKQRQGDTNLNEQLAEVVNLFVENNQISKLKLMEKLDDTILGDCGLIETENFKRKRIRIMTRNMYHVLT